MRGRRNSSPKDSIFSTSKTCHIHVHANVIANVIATITTPVKARAVQLSLADEAGKMTIDVDLKWYLLQMYNLRQVFVLS